VTEAYSFFYLFRHSAPENWSKGRLTKVNLFVLLMVAVLAAVHLLEQLCCLFYADQNSFALLTKRKREDFYSRQLVPCRKSVRRRKKERFFKVFERLLFVYSNVNVFTDFC